MKRTILFLVLHFIFNTGHAQTDSVKYTKGFVFKDGIYIYFDDFKNNSPRLTIEKFSVYNPGYTLSNDTILSETGKRIRSINFPDSSGKAVSIDLDSIWGYCVDGKPFCSYTELSNGLYFSVDKSGHRKSVVLSGFRLFIIGKVCHLYGSVTQTGSGYDLNGSGEWRPGGSYEYESEKQYLLSFDTGRQYKFKLNELSNLIQKKDPELFNEFSNLSTSKQKQMMFFYLNKLNERNPIYFRAQSESK